MLNVPLRVGSGDAGRIVLAHGFTQSGMVWADLAHRLAADGFEVVAPDLPGHGKTDPKYDSIDLWEAGRLLGEAGGKATYVGYSLGGRVLLHTALLAEYSHLVERILIVGAKAGFKDPNAAAQRVADDNALADHIEALGDAGKFDVFIDEWLQHPVNIRLSPGQTHRELRLQNRPRGVASSLRHCGSGVQEPLWQRLNAINVSVLVAFAEYDTPTILEDNAGIAKAIGSNARQLVFDGVGHSIPFEAPDMFADVVLQFAGGEWPPGAHKL